MSGKERLAVGFGTLIPFVSGGMIKGGIKVVEHADEVGSVIKGTRKGLSNIDEFVDLTDFRTYIKPSQVRDGEIRKDRISFKLD